MKLATQPQCVIEAFTLMQDDRPFKDKVKDFFKGKAAELTPYTYAGRAVAQDIELFDPLDTLTFDHKISEIRATYNFNGTDIHFTLFGVIPLRSENGVKVCALDHFEQEPC